MLDYDSIAGMIDHSLLKPTMTDDEWRAGCEYAKEARVASVCVKPYTVRTAAEILAGSTVAVGATVGFPHGSHTTSTKAFEAEQAILDGATELDMVVNVGKVLSEDWAYVGTDIGAVVSVARGRALVKVIFENSAIEDRHKIRLCEICTAVGADFAKTSTGYGDGGATDHDLRLMLSHLPGKTVQVKAAGGIRTLDRLLAVRELGVSRVGCTATREILDELERRLRIAGG